MEQEIVFVDEEIVYDKEIGGEKCGNEKNLDIG